MNVEGIQESKVNEGERFDAWKKERPNGDVSIYPILEEMIPENHILRWIEKPWISFLFMTW